MGEFDWASMLGSIGGAGINAYAQVSGQNRQQAFANTMYQNELAQRNASMNDYASLAGSMPNFASMFGNMPNANQYFNQDPSQYYKTSDLNPDQYFSSDMVNKNYDTALANLSRLQGSQMGQAAQSAGESAAARGLTNPTAYTGQARQQVMNAYAPQFGQLEQGRNSALMQNSQNLYGAKANQQQFNAGQLSGLYGAKTNQQQNLYSALMQQLQMRMQGSQNDWSNNFGLHSAMNNTMLGG